MSLPAGVLPVQDLTTEQILYGVRETSYRFELLTHDPVTGLDSLAGYLDGVQSDGSLQWVSNASVKKSGTLTVNDLEVAGAGLTRVRDINLLTTRIRPVLVVEGLPEMPLGVYVLTAAPEAWAGTGRTFSFELHDKSTVLEQDAFDVSYTADTTDTVLEIVAAVIESAGERIAVDGSDVRTLPNPLVWEAGTSKLRIVNDLLDALAYNSLWVDGAGSFRATPYVKPVDRSVRYSMLNDAVGASLQRELVDGDKSIYSPEWTRDRDTYKVPNKVVTVAAGTGDAAPLSGSATNTDASSPFSTVSRGRTIVRVVEGVDVPDFSAEGDPVAVETAFLNARALQTLTAVSAVQAAVKVKCLPIPVELLDVVRFASTPAGIDRLHVVRGVGLPLSFDGLMELDLQEVVSL